MRDTIKPSAILYPSGEIHTNYPHSHTPPLETRDRQIAAEKQWVFCGDFSGERWYNRGVEEIQLSALLSANKRGIIMANFMFPIADNGQWQFKEGLEANHDNFLKLFDQDRKVEWKISNGYKLISEGDYVWAYLTAPTMQVRGLGKVLKDKPGVVREKHYRVPILWSGAGTRALTADPIPYSQFEQRIQGAVVRASDRTDLILQEWRARHPDIGI